MNCNIISTGSKGNAVVLNNTILIDCGVTFKALKDVYKNLSIVLLTHIHNDHFKKSTIRKLAKERPQLYFACCDWLASELVACGVEKRNIFIMNYGTLYDCGSVILSPIKLYHDVSNCGWRIYIGDKKAVYMTDTKTVEGITAKDYDLYLIEANYEDTELQERIDKKLETGEFIYEYKLPDRHLSKAQADEFICQNIGSKGRFIYLHQHE